MPTETTIEIATLMPWGEPKTINVRGVDKILRKAAPTEAFWQVWRSAKEQLKAAGVTCGQYQGQWEVCWWRDADPEAQAKREAKLADEQQKLTKALAGEVAVLPDEYENRMRQFEPMCLGYQVPSVRRQVRALLDYNGALDASDTGTGKTYVSLATCAVLGLPAFAVCPIAVRTSWKRAADHFRVKMAGVWNYELLREGSLPEICEVKFKWVPAPFKKGKPQFNRDGQPKMERELESVTWKLPKDTVIIFDECHRCFPPETMVLTEHGPLSIGNIVESKLQIRVASCNLSSGAIQFRRVTGHFKFAGERLVKVTHSTGSFTCTPDHQIWCADIHQWKEACALAGHSVLAVRQGEVSSIRTGQESKVLQPEVFGYLAMQPAGLHGEVSENQKVKRMASQGVTDHDKTDVEPKIEIEAGCNATNAVQQPKLAGGCEGEDRSKFSKPDMAGTRRQRSSNEATDCAGTGNQSANGVCDRSSIMGVQQVQITASQLQGGFGLPGSEAGNRSGWSEPQNTEVEVLGFPQGKYFEVSRVVSVEVLESRGGQQPNGCGWENSGVYCIEVEGNHNFFADGVLVANCKNYKTLNCAIALAALRQGYKVIGVSATAADNPMQMKFSALLTGLIRNEREFYPWMLRNGVERGRFGLEFNGGRAALERIHKSIFPLHGTRIRIADLGDQFPETQITAECYETDAEAINRVNEEMAEGIARIRASEMEDAKKQACILTEQLRARQRTEIIKVPAAVDMIEDWVDDGMSVAVFVNFKETLAALAAKLKTKCVIQGDQSETERQANIDAFQQDKAHVILAIIQAGGVGVSLHGSPTSRMRASLIFPCWSGQDMKQAFGRVWRANGAKSIQRIFFAAGTIEQDVCDGVNAKISRIDVLNDGIPDEVLRLKGECVDFAAEASERLAFVRPPAPRQANGATSVTFQPAPERPTVTYTPSPEEQKRKERRDKDAKLAARLTREQIDRAHRAMQQLAGMDGDRAAQRNDMGFGKFDVRTGHALANSESLTAAEGAVAIRLARKYRRQVGDLFPEIYGAKGNE